MFHLSCAYGWNFIFWKHVNCGTIKSSNFIKSVLRVLGKKEISDQNSAWNYAAVELNCACVVVHYCNFLPLLAKGILVSQHGDTPYRCLPNVLGGYLIIIILFHASAYIRVLFRFCKPGRTSAAATGYRANACSPHVMQVRVLQTLHYSFLVHLPYAPNSTCSK